MTADDYAARGFVVIEELLGASHVAMLDAAMDVSQRSGALAASEYVAGAEDEYSPGLGELYLRHCRPAVEAAIGCALIETYAYWRLYREGAVLEAHTDRASCEVTVSVTVGSDPAGQPWPFWLTDLSGETVAVTLAPGAAIIVQGHRVPHWREPLAGRAHKQMFLHYVHAGGAYAAHAFDGRGADVLGHIRGS